MNREARNILVLERSRSKTGGASHCLTDSPNKQLLKYRVKAANPNGEALCALADRGPACDFGFAYLVSEDK